MFRTIYFISIITFVGLAITGCTTTSSAEQAKSQLMATHGEEANAIIKKNRTTKADTIQVLVASYQKSERPNSFIDFIMGVDDENSRHGKYVTYVKEDVPSSITSKSQQTYVSSILVEGSEETTAELSDLTTGMNIKLVLVPNTGEIELSYQANELIQWFDFEPIDGIELQTPETKEIRFDATLAKEDEPHYFSVGDRAFLVAF